MRSFRIFIAALLFCLAIPTMLMADESSTLNQYVATDLARPDTHHAGYYIGACETFCSIVGMQDLLAKFGTSSADSVNKFYMLQARAARWPEHIAADCAAYLKLAPSGNYSRRAKGLQETIAKTDFTVKGVRPLSDSMRATIKRTYVEILLKGVDKYIATLRAPGFKATEFNRRKSIELRAHLRWALEDGLITQQQFSARDGKLVIP